MRHNQPATTLTATAPIDFFCLSLALDCFVAMDRGS
jgi:hypothetical protein